MSRKEALLLVDPDRVNDRGHDRRARAAGSGARPPGLHLSPLSVFRAAVSQTLLPSTKMVAELPGAWRFVYTTSEYGFRAPTMAVSNRYDRPNVVVLGDSYSFGNGVNDGEEYPAVLAGLLGEPRQRRQSGRARLRPDPADQIVLRVRRRPTTRPSSCSSSATTIRTTICSIGSPPIEDGRFVFKAGPLARHASCASVKNLLERVADPAKPALQFRAQHGRMRPCARGMSSRSSTHDDPRGKERLYNELLDLLVRDLDGRGIDVVFFAVTDHLAPVSGHRREGSGARG